MSNDKQKGGALVMSEEKTREQTDPRSFEEQVFARFDAIDARLQSLETLMEQSTDKPKSEWNRALTDIAKIRRAMRKKKKGRKK